MLDTAAMNASRRRRTANTLRQPRDVPRPAEQPALAERGTDAEHAPPPRAPAEQARNLHMGRRGAAEQARNAAEQSEEQSADRGPAGCGTSREL
jgi:hypothetical protein